MGYASEIIKFGHGNLIYDNLAPINSMKQQIFIAIAIAIILAGITGGLLTIAPPGFAQNATFGNITDGNSTEIIAPSEDGGYSEEGGWG
jgi:hypothetical protein